MAFDKAQLCDLITRTLTRMDLHSDAAVNLLLGTAAVESDFGAFLKQQNDGPALGIYQMEPATEEDIWNNWLKYRHLWTDRIWVVCGKVAPTPLALEGDLIYQTIMARLHYLRVKEPLPAPDDVPGLARYWKRYWNTKAGSGKETRFLVTYAKYVQGE